jgi:PAS domain S-box-containing protein
LEQVASIARAHAATVRCYQADLARDGDLSELMGRLKADCEAVDYLIHSAGLIAVSPVEQAELDTFDQQYRTNVRAPFALTQSLLPLLRRAGGQVVFINSSAGMKGLANSSQYAATKHALRAVADALRDEINDEGVRVLSVFLGRTATAMQAAVHAIEGKPYHPEVLIQPDEAAEMILQLIHTAHSAEVTDISLRPFLRPGREDVFLSLVEDTVLVRYPNGTIQFWNKGAEQTYGWTARDSVGRISHQLLQTHFPQPLQSIEDELLQAGRWEGELVHTRRDGSTVIVASRWELQRDSNQQPSVVLEVNVPLGPATGDQADGDSRSVQAERLGNFGAWTWDARSNRVAWSDELCRLYGLSPKEFRGDYQLILDRMHPDDREPTRSLVVNAYQKQQPFSLRHRVLQLDGSERVLQVSGEVVVDSSGHVVMMFGTAHAVRERAWVQEDLRKVQQLEAQLEDCHVEIRRLRDVLREETSQRKQPEAQGVKRASREPREATQEADEIRSRAQHVSSLLEALAERDRRITALETELRNLRGS